MGGFMQTLELFSGTKSFSKVARELGHKTFTVDNDPSLTPDLCSDLENLESWELEYDMPLDVLWASPPCQGFSVASIGRMWENNHETPMPKHPTSKLGLRLLGKTIEFIRELEPRYWFIENPRGMMRKMPELKGVPRTTVTYCQYGDTRMKPTDIWHNLIGWQGKACKNGMGCHEKAPRGSRTGTQGLKGAKDRGRIPPALFKEIFKLIEIREGSL